ncbi:ASKHA domain-containing protein [Inediibacterium massiliense]|uniref:ASKHA domain-containing protein n=1 Tax=Inediibacterium massiliense TaxID=1658111 RepID=UPI0006B46D2A|nr:ASKHA domain-containing protein [Inediibacterium massiliense]
MYLKVEGKKYSFEKGENLFHVLLNYKIKIETSCGGNGICGKCKVKILQGQVEEMLEEEQRYLSQEEINEGIRLACMIKPTSNITIQLLKENKEEHKILTNVSIPYFPIQPSIQKKVYSIPKMKLKQYNSYENFLKGIVGLNRGSFPIDIIRKLPEILEENEVTAIYQKDELIGVEPKNTSSLLYGVVVDIGTTTVVASLVDLNEKKEMSSERMLNPQNQYGLDILSRIKFVKSKKEGLEILQKNVIDCLNQLIEKLCRKHKIFKKNIYEIVVGGNNAMMHFFLGVQIDFSEKSPSVPVFCEPKNIKSSMVGIEIAPFANVYCLPSVSSYIGADIVGGILVSGLYKKNKNVLFVDIGVSGEIVLSKSGELSSCFCSSGPALQGMNIEYGIGSCEGAIEVVKIEGGKISFKTIENKQPLGICGSGIVDIIAQMLQRGMLHSSGRIKKKKQIPIDFQKFIIEEEKKRKMIVDEEHNIFITQEDIRQIQLAKGAILSGIYVILHENDLRVEDIDEVMIAGEFREYLNVESLVRIGMMPEKLKDKAHYIGNSSRIGALMCLLSQSIRQEIEGISKKIKYIELSKRKGYKKLLMDCLKFIE